MSSAERAALNTSRQTSLSSQMAAICAADRDDDSPSPPSGGNKGKLEQMKMETDIKQEESESNDYHHDGHGGKGIKSEMKTEIKTEVKQEPMDEGVPIKQEPGAVKEEAGGVDSSADVKPSMSDTANATGTGGERKHKSE